MRLGERSGLLPSDRSRRSASAKRARHSPRSPAAQAPGSLTRRPLACGLGGLDSELSVSTRRPCEKTRWLRQVPPPSTPGPEVRSAVSEGFARLSHQVVARSWDSSPINPILAKGHIAIHPREGSQERQQGGHLSIHV